MWEKASKKEENTELMNGCIAKGVWEKITSSDEYKKIESMELEELEAYRDPILCPDGWLDKEPSPRKKKLKLSSKKASIRCPCNIKEPR